MKTGIFLTILTLIMFSSVGVLAGNFTDNSDGTVTDNVTGFMWQQEDDNIRYTWEQALTYCEGLTLASHGDWRLPNIKELESIIDLTANKPAIDAIYFPGTNLSYYWSSTTSSFSTSSACYVHFSYGVNTGGTKAYDSYVRCVR